tara:strand:+ start:822 stop:1010 length:189 start_codon:yes stop_codon:yes gene_type:complete
MILFGVPIHRKYSKRIFKFFVLVFAIVIFVLLVSCSKLEFNNFDPATSTLRYIITKDTKWKQ